MKQYFTGFFTAVCLTTSVFLFIGADDIDIKKEMVFKDDNGIAIINGSGIKCFNLDGDVVSRLGVAEEGGMFWLADNDGQIKVGAKIDDGKGGSFSTFSPNGNMSAFMKGSNSGGSIAIFSSDQSQEVPVRLAISVSEKDGGDIQLWNNKGNTTAVIGALYNERHKGDGFINLFDRYGDFGWSASGKN